MNKKKIKSADTGKADTLTPAATAQKDIKPQEDNQEPVAPVKPLHWRVQQVNRSK